jgi:hypothetical protein
MDHYQMTDDITMLNVDIRRTPPDAIRLLYTVFGLMEEQLIFLTDTIIKASTVTMSRIAGH